MSTATLNEQALAAAEPVYKLSVLAEEAAQPEINGYHETLTTTMIFAFSLPPAAAQDKERAAGLEQ